MLCGGTVTVGGFWVGTKMSGSKKPLSPLAKAFVFYGSYHSDHTNQVIHVACVPVILTTALGFLAKLPLPASAGALVPAIAKRAFGAAASTWALPVAVGYAGYYLSLAPGLLGASAAALVLGGLKLSTVAQALVSNRVLVGAHVVSWLAQFVGHGVYEGRSPALLDNLFQAIFMAPFFVCAWS